MTAISQKFSAVVQFSGKIDSSWTRSADGIKKSLSEIDKQSQALTRDQKKLAAEIKRAKLAGQSVSELERRYSDVTREIRKAEQEQSRLNKALQRTQRFTRFKGFGAGLMRHTAGVTRGFGRLARPVGLALGGGAITTALAGLLAPVATNAVTAERAGIAKSYGVDVPTFIAWDNLAKQFGMNGENFGDLYEEYLHKSGEYKQNRKQGGLQDAFETLGFHAGEFAGLSDLQQFNKIVERALSLPDQSKASFALDSLFGGEASKLLMLLRQSGRSFRDMIDEQRRYNLVTREGADGAIKGHLAISNLSSVLTSSISEISGLLGSELAPEIRVLTDDLADWFRHGGIKKVVGFIRDDLIPGIITFGQGVQFIGRIIFATAKKLSWLLPDERYGQKQVFYSLGRYGSVEAARRTAQHYDQTEWFENLLRENPELSQQVRDSFLNTRGYFFDDDDTFYKSLDKYLTPENSNTVFDWNKSLTLNRARLTGNNPAPSGTPGAATLNKVYGLPAPAGGGSLTDLVDQLEVAERLNRQVNDNRSFTWHVQINAATGQDPREIARQVRNLTLADPEFTGDSSLYDKGEGW